MEISAVVIVDGKVVLSAFGDAVDALDATNMLEQDLLKNSGSLAQSKQPGNRQNSRCIFACLRMALHAGLRLAADDLGVQIRAARTAQLECERERDALRAAGGPPWEVALLDLESRYFEARFNVFSHLTADAAPDRSVG